MLLGVAVADDRLLDESRAVFSYLNSGALGGHENDAPDLTQFQSDFDVCRVEGFFYRANVRLQTLDDGFDAIADFQEARRELVARRSLDRAVFDEPVATRFALNHAPARRLTPRINS